VSEKLSVYKAIAEVRDAVGHVDKDGRHEFLNYNYATETSLARALRPVLKKAGLLIIPSVDHFYIDKASVTHLLMEYTIVHVETGEYVGPLKCLGAGVDVSKQGVPGDKAAYKANTGAYKYFLMRTFMIDTGDDPEVPRDDEKGDDVPRAPNRPERKAGTPPRASDASSSGGSMANEGQVKMLMAVSFERAEQLIEDGPGQDFENKFKLGGALRRSAYSAMGIPNEKTIPRSAVNGLKRMIQEGNIGEDGNVFVVDDDGAPF
jgi:hypothetical protein